MQKEVKEIFVNSPFPRDLEKQARIAAAKMGVSRAELVRKAVADYLGRLEAQTISSRGVINVPN